MSEICGAEVYRSGKPTGERCSKPAGHKSAHSAWWPKNEPQPATELQPFATAPRDATEILAWTTDRYGNRRWLVIHWAQGGGEEQPPFRGWFYHSHGDGYAEIEPKYVLGWVALPARPQENT